MKDSDAVFSLPRVFAELGLDSLLETFPQFEKSELFSVIIFCLKEGKDKEILIRLYDQIFVECLTYVKSYEEIAPGALLESIKRKQNLTLDLRFLEKRLQINPYETIHDITLYLAWDRVCVYSAILFEYPFKEPCAIQGLDVFKDCLLESYQHIKGQARSDPSFFRLMEALYAYYMREEKLQTHTEQEWQILCRSATVLRPRDLLCDVSYVDFSVKKTGDVKNPCTVFTSDCEEVVQNSLAFAGCIMKKIQKHDASWVYEIDPIHISLSKP